LIREISIANPLWGAPRIHGDLIKLGIDIGQSSVAKYMVRTRRPPSSLSPFDNVQTRGFAMVFPTD